MRAREHVVGSEADCHVDGGVNGRSASMNVATRGYTASQANSVDW